MNKCAARSDMHPLSGFQRANGAVAAGLLTRFLVKYAGKAAMMMREFAEVTLIIFFPPPLLCTVVSVSDVILYTYYAGKKERF